MLLDVEENGEERLELVLEADTEDVTELGDGVGILVNTLVKVPEVEVLRIVLGMIEELEPLLAVDPDEEGEEFGIVERPMLDDGVLGAEEPEDAKVDRD